MSDRNQAVRSITGAIPLPPGVEAMQIGVKIAGQWHWNTISSPSPAPAPARPLPQSRSSLPAPRAANRRPAAPEAQARREVPAMTQGRDPGRFLFTFGKYRGQYAEDVDAYELADWHEYWVKEMARLKKTGGEPVGTQLEVAVEMVGAFLNSMRPAGATGGKR